MWSRHNMNSADNACKLSWGPLKFCQSSRLARWGLNYTTVAVSTDTYRSDVPVCAVCGSIRIAIERNTKTAAMSIIAFSMKLCHHH